MKEQLSKKQGKGALAVFSEFYWRAAFILDRGFKDEAVERISVEASRGKGLNKVSTKILSLLPKQDQTRIQNLGNL